MKYNNFVELSDACDELIMKGKYKEALVVLEEGMGTLSNNEQEKFQFYFMNHKRWLLYKSEMYDEFYDYLSQMIAKGVTFPLYRHDSEKQNPQFIVLKKRNDLLLEEMQKKSKFEYVVYVPDDYNERKKYPVFFNLHGDEDSMEFHKQCWKPDWLLKNGFIVVYLQSSQIVYNDAHVWIDREMYLKGEKNFRGGKSGIYNKVYGELKNCYDLISKKYSINEDQIIIGGFSGGAVAAIDIALSNAIPIKGAIALCSLRPMSFTEENVKTAHENGVKFVFMEGEEDAPVQDIEDMKEECKRQGVPFEYYINKGMGHEYPEDLNSKLEKALNFILEKEG